MNLSNIGLENEPLEFLWYIDRRSSVLHAHSRTCMQILTRICRKIENPIEYAPLRSWSKNACVKRCAFFGNGYIDLRMYPGEMRNLRNFRIERFTMHTSCQLPTATRRTCTIRATIRSISGWYTSRTVITGTDNKNSRSFWWSKRRIQAIILLLSEGGCRFTRDRKSTRLNSSH